MNNILYFNVDPIIFRIGPISVGWYGLMVALAVFFVIGWVLWQNRKYKIIDNDAILTAALIGIPSGVIFSKILHVIDQWKYYIENPGQILSGQGLTIWGAVLGATIGVWLYSRISRHIPFADFGDLIAPGIIFAQAIGRVGCTFNGCCYGLESDAACAVIYTNPGSYAPVGIPILPTQIFEIGYDLIVFVILLFLRGKLKPAGSLLVVYFALYAVWRFGIEFIRAGTPFLFGMHQAQFIALIVLLITLPIIIFKVRWKRKESAASPETSENLKE